MEIFKIEIIETFSRVIEIEADSVDEAFSNIQDLYNNEEIVLDATDYIDTDFLEYYDELILAEKDKLILEVIDYMYENEKKHFEEFEIEPENHIYKKLLRLKFLI